MAALAGWLTLITDKPIAVATMGNQQAVDILLQFTDRNSTKSPVKWVWRGDS